MTPAATDKKFIEYVEQCGFYKPFKDYTNKVDFMRYCNSELSYGYNQENEKFYLCNSPILEAVIISIISEYNNFEDLKEAFFNYKANNIIY